MCSWKVLYLNNVLLKEIVPKQCDVKDRYNCMGIQLKEFWVSMILLRDACLKVSLSKGISEVEIFAWGKGIYVSRK